MGAFVLCNIGYQMRKDQVRFAAGGGLCIVKIGRNLLKNFDFIA